MLTRGSFSTHRKKAKTKKYHEAANIIGATFIPLLLEMYGSFGKVFNAFIKSTATEYVNRGRNNDPDTLSNLKSPLSKLWTA